MDRKSKRNSVNDGKSSNGGNNCSTKEEALQKLQGMEWVRNKQEQWHLSRPTVKNDVYPVEKKKYDEDNYFNGKSGNQKNKRTRKLQETPVKPKVLTGFTFTSTKEAPTVNAWTQKKGSDLFDKPPEELDLDEDTMLKLVLEESLKTAELDKLRNMERMRLYGASYTAKGFTENKIEDDLEEKDHENNNCVSPIQLNKIQSKPPDLQFVDTDSLEDLDTMSRKSESPQANVSRMKFNIKVHPSDKNTKLEYHPPQKDSDDDDVFESSRSTENLSLASEKSNFNHAASQSTRAFDEIAMIESKIPIVISDNCDKPIVDDLSAKLKSTLTFRDTKGLLDNMLFDDCDYKSQSAAQSSPINSSVFEAEMPVHASYGSNVSASSNFNLPSSLPSENDILIHSFLRHEPPSLAPDMIFQETERPAEVFSLNASQQYFSPNSLPEKDGQSFLNSLISKSQSQSISIDSGQSSNSSISNSPLQNVSPFGSLDKHIVTNPGGLMHTQPHNVPFHPLHLVNEQNQGIANKLQEPQLASHFASQVPYPGCFPGVVTHSVHPGHLNSTIPKISPYQLHNSNMMMPLLFSNQEVLNSVNEAPQPQAQAQYYYQLLMLQQYQQAQNAAISMNNLENQESLLKVQQPLAGQHPTGVYGQVQPQLQQYQQAQNAAISMNNLENQESLLKVQQPLVGQHPTSVYGQVQPQLQQYQQAQNAAISMNNLENQESLLKVQQPLVGQHPTGVYGQVQPQLQQYQQAQNAAISMNDLENQESLLKVQQPLVGQHPTSVYGQVQPLLQHYQQAQNAAISMNNLENQESLLKAQQPLVGQHPTSVYGQVQPQLQHYQQAQQVALSMNDREHSESLYKDQQLSMFGQVVTQSENHRSMNSTENQSHLFAHNLYPPRQSQMKDLQNQQTEPQVVPKYDIPFSTQDGLPVMHQQPNSAEQVFQSVAQSKPEIYLQYQKVQQQLQHLKQLLDPHGQSQAMSMPNPLLIPTPHSMAIGLNNYYAPSLHAMNQQIPVQLVENPGQLSPNQQDLSVASGMLNMIPDTDNQTSLQPKIGRGRGKLI